MAKLPINLLIIYLLAVGFAIGGWVLYSKGSRELAKLNQELGYKLSSGPELAIYQEGDSGVVFVACLFADLPTGTTVYFSAPTIGFGRFLMFISVVLVAVGIWRLRHARCSNALLEAV